MNILSHRYWFFLLFMSGVLQGNAAETRCPIAELAVCPAPMDNPIPDVKNMLTWSQSERIVGFRNTYRSYSGDVFKAGNAEPLPVSYRNLDDVGYIYQGKHYGLQEYLRRNNVTAMMVIKDGHIVWDYYGNGNTKTTLWTSRSVGKSVVSTLLGIALKEGKISSLADPLSKYNPDVKGTVWQKVTLGQLLQHVSGVTWNEDYTNPHSDFAKLTQCEAGNNTYDCVSKLVLDPNRTAYAQPGEIWSYSSAGAWLLGDTLEKATGKSLAQYLQEKIWQPAGMVQDGVWQSYAKNKHDVGAHGVNATLQDWGKFGLFVMTGGELPDGTKCLPNNWIEQSRDWTKAKYSVSSNYPQGIYGFQWWNNSVPATAKDVWPKRGLPSNTLWAEGIFGQLIAVSPEKKMVIVQWSSWPEAEPKEDAEPLEASLMFNAITNYLTDDVK